MVSGGFVAAGYTWLNLDDGIVEVGRDANGDLVADKKGFPNGFAPVAAYVKANGMQFGVYTDRGTQTCGGRAGALGHEAADAAFYARNGITYLKARPGGAGYFPRPAARSPGPPDSAVFSPRRRKTRAMPRRITRLPTLNMQR